ncbi:hypothetical protein ACGGZK_18530 [Agromyces sp. MMS24-K17]|uniref:hypothetical protein n=1 Tax=Agromyces sp. MMS24-K17 TaxID=3372850 RepID=UPI0037544238
MHGGADGEADATGRPDAAGIVLLVDVANVMGSTPDGWWRDRAGAATRLLVRLVPLVGRVVEVPDASPAVIARVVAVVEGQAKGVAAPDGVEVVRAPRDGDTTIVEVAETGGAGHPLVVVTADRGLRDRLPAGVQALGPGWLNALIGR